MKKNKKKEVSKENEQEEMEALRFYYVCEEIRRTGISPGDFVNACDIMAFASLFAQRFDHGAGLSVNTSEKPVRKYFVGKTRKDIIGMCVNIRSVKISLGDLLVSLDGGGALVKGRVVRVGSMIAMGARNCEKAMKVLSNGEPDEARKRGGIDHDTDGTHTRHGSMTAYSMKNPHSVNFVASHKGRVTILVRGRVVAQISRIEGPDGPTFVVPYSGVGFPNRKSEILVRTGAARVRDIVSRGFHSGDAYGEYLLKAQAEEKWRKKLAVMEYVNNLTREARRDVMKPGVTSGKSVLTHQIKRPGANYAYLMERTRFLIDEKQTRLEEFLKKLKKRLH